MRTIILFALLQTITVKSQPWNYTSPGNVNMTSGVIQNQPLYDNKHRVTLGTNGFALSSSSIFDIKPSNEIHLVPGFQAGPYTTGDAYLHLKGLSVGSFHQNGFTNIPKYDRLEIGMVLPVSVQQQIDNFFNSSYTGTNKLNPYDPDQIRVECVFQTPSNPNVYYKRPGFYYTDWTPGPTNKWTALPTNYKFRIRFAPPLVGPYLGTIFIYLNQNTTPLTDIGSCEFNVVQSSNRGHLSVNTIDPNNIQKLRYDDGIIFFGIGMNVAHPYWNDDATGYDKSCTDGMNTPTTPNRHNEHRIFLEGISDNKGNFARVRLDNWSVPLETVDYSIPCPAQLQNKNKYLNNYEHNQPLMWEMDKTLALCERKGIHLMLNILADWDFNPYLQKSGKSLWNENPYSSIVTQPEYFFTDPNAIAIFKKRLYYLHARWGYSTSIALWELINETENIADYQNNPYGINSLRSAIYSWLCIMTGYLHSLEYPQHPVTNGTTWLTLQNYGPIYSNNQSQCLDVYSSNSYHAGWNAGLFNDDNCYIRYELLKQHSKYWKPVPTTGDLQRKPFVWGETGIGPDEVSAALDDRSNYSFHSQVWSTIFSNSLGTGLEFFSWNNLGTCPPSPGPTFRMKHFNAMKVFTDRINFDQLLLPDINEQNTDLPGPNGHGNWRNNIVYPETENPNIITFWMRTCDKKTVYGWSWNTSANWSNDYNTNLCLPFPPDQIAPLDLKYGLPNGFAPTPAVTIQSSQNAIKMQGLVPNSCYNINIYDAWAPGNDLLQSLTATTDANGRLRFGRMMPTFSVNLGGSLYYPDYAFIATLCEGFEGEVCADGQGSRTSISHQDAEGGEISLTQKINTIPDQKINTITEIKIFPVPASDLIFINLSKSKILACNISITDEIGRVFKPSIREDSGIDVSGLKNGFYLLEIRDGGINKTFKIIIQH